VSEAKPIMSCSTGKALQNIDSGLATRGKALDGFRFFFGGWAKIQSGIDDFLSVVAGLVPATSIVKALRQSGWPRQARHDTSLEENVFYTLESRRNFLPNLFPLNPSYGPACHYQKNPSFFGL
jgi:hypothetical protein